MKSPVYKHIISHPDRDEIISKLAIGQSIKDVHDWLANKYSAVSERKFVLPQATLKAFQTTYLDFYNEVRQNLSKGKAALQSGNEEQLEKIVKGNSAYRDAIIKTLDNEIDIRQMISRLIVNIETRLAQIFDAIQDNPKEINSKIDRLLIDYTEVFGSLLEKCYKFNEVPKPDTLIQNNITLQVVDQHISVFHNVIKEVLAQMDLETSMYFMEVYNQKMSKLKPPTPQAEPSQEMRMAEAKLLGEKINKTLSDHDQAQK